MPCRRTCSIFTPSSFPAFNLDFCPAESRLKVDIPQRQMNEADSPQETPLPGPPPPDAPGRWTLPNLRPAARWYGCVGCLVLVGVAFLGPLVEWFARALRMGLDSYILLIPAVSAYLLHLDARRLPRDYSTAPGWTAGFAAAGSAAVAAGWCMRSSGGGDAGESVYLAWMTFAFLCWIVAVGFFFLGRPWMTRAAFPAAFLIFMIPLPDATVAWLENVSKLASTEVASLFFDLSGTPNLRDGTFFQLPNVTIEVARECSGIRSSLVLFITSLLASYLLLNGVWRRALVVLLVIPLGFLRNGFRIWTLGQLCVYVGPHMLHSLIHTRGGPVFFVLSLLPLFALIWWLRRGESRT